MQREHYAADFGIWRFEATNKSWILVVQQESRSFLLPVNEPPPHAALEEAAAAVAGVDAIVFPAAGVAAHFADQSRAQSFARGRTLGCETDTVTRGRSVSAIRSAWYCFTHVPAICTVSSVCMRLSSRTKHTSQYCNRRLGLKISLSGWLSN